jgi:prepilin-type N-terminal cleavage/methylation domain-containing protein
VVSKKNTAEDGFTLVELLVGVVMLGVVSLAFYQVMIASSRSADTARAVTKVSEEARLGFGRMVRDTREGRRLVEADDVHYKVEVDFNGDGAIEPEGTTNSDGDFEVLTFVFDDTANTVTLNGDVLMRRVQCAEVSGSCRPFFTYSSNRLEYDWNNNGVTSWQELDAAPSHGVIGVGNGDGSLNAAELPFVSNVGYELRVVERDSFTEFVAEAQLRNLR